MDQARRGERYGSDGRAVILSATDPLPHARHTQLDSPWGPLTRRCGRFLFASNRSHRRSTSPIKMHRAPQETERNAYRPEESIHRSTSARSLFLSLYISSHEIRKRINPRIRDTRDIRGQFEEYFGSLDRKIDYKDRMITFTR